MFAPLPWQDQKLLQEKLLEVRSISAEARLARGRWREAAGPKRSCWRLRAGGPGLLMGGRNG